MQSENNVQLNLDISEVKGHLNSIENRLEKIRYLKQYIPLLAEYAVHEPLQVEKIVAEMPSVIREEIWKIYSEELGFEGSNSDSNTSVEQKKEEVKFQEPKKDDPVREKQKSKRTNQLHELIEKVYLTLLESNEIRPSASEVWNELMTNEKKYDVDEIIQEVVKFKAIYWISKDDKVQEMKWSTFKKQLSIIRSK